MVDKLLGEAFAAGIDAVCFGYDRDANPYDYENDLDLYEAWELGFEDAMNEQQSSS